MVKVSEKIDSSLFLPILPSFTAMKAWREALNQLKPDMPKAAFDRYLLAATLERYEADAGRVVIRAPDEKHRAWLEGRMTSTLNRILAGMCYPAEVSVQFIA